MEKEEKYIDATFGCKDPFRVPDGYFDDFTGRLMSRLPDAPEAPVVNMQITKGSLWMRYRKYVAIAAASVCIGIVSVGTYFHHKAEVADKNNVAGVEMSSSSYSTMDALTDYTMLDSDDMYAYMADIK